MFNEVRIYKADGNLNKIISSRELSQRYWENLQKNKLNIRTLKKSQKLTGCLPARGDELLNLDPYPQFS